MDLSALMDSRYFAYLILPILIFVARVLDVTLGTISIVFVSRGKKFLARPRRHRQGQPHFHGHQAERTPQSDGNHQAIPAPVVLFGGGCPAGEPGGFPC